MTEEQPFALTNLCYLAGDFRRMVGGLVCEEGTAGPTDLLVGTNGVGLQVIISDGDAFIRGDDTPEQGFYFTPNPSSTILTAATADPTNPRIDLVRARVRDSDYGGTDDDWVLEIVTGFPTVGANLTNLSGAAALGNDAIALAYVLVPAGFAGPFVTATHILDVRVPFSACGEGYSWSTKFVRSTAQSLANTTATTVSFPAGSTGTPLAYNWLSEASGTVTVKRAGLYLLTGTIQWANNATGYRWVVLTSAGDVAAQRGAAAPTLQTNQTVSQVVSLAAADTIVMTGRQSSGGALDIESAALTVTRLGKLVV